MMRRAFQVALLCAPLAGTVTGLALAAPKRILETSFLVLPNEPAGVVGEVPPASDFRAMAGNVEFEVRSATRAGDLKTIVVFDLASIAREGLAALIDQARAMQPELRQMRNVSLFVVSTEWTQFHKTFEFGPGQTYEYFLPETESAAGDRAGPPLSPGQLPWAAQGGFSLDSFRGLAEILRSERGPVRVLWIGQNFGWVTPPHHAADRFARTPWQEQDVLERKVPFYSAFAPLDAFTQAGADFWPIVWLSGLSGPDRNFRSDLKQASDIAQYLGGEANTCSGDLAGCLKSVLKKSSRDGWIIRIAGPPVDWTNDTAKLLHVWYAPNRAVLDLKRPFVRLKQPKVWVLERRVGAKRVPTIPGTAPPVPLFDSIDLSGRAGCGVSKGSETEKLEMTAIVPDAFVPGLRAQVEVIGEQMELHNRSTPKPVLVRETWQGAAEMCVDLPPTSQTKALYRIVVFNPEAGWAGVGFLPVSDVIHNRSRL
jgi:hypothetical protein